jgi:nicotinamidase-related amidase
MAKVGLIIIDGQKDFCEGGKLAVTGGNECLEKVSDMIDRIGDKLYNIDLTFDAHHQHHIAHSCMWVDNDGNNPPPFTLMTPADVIGTGAQYRAANIGYMATQEKYIQELAKRNDSREAMGLLRIEHCIWPEHCLIGTDGMSLNERLLQSIMAWELKKKRPTNKTTKGSFMFAEHFSVFKAEVPNDLDPATKTNMHLINNLSSLDMLAWAGLAKDYCLMNSFIDFILELSGGDQKIAEDISKKMVFIEDGTASVGAVPALADKFDEFLTKWGVERVKAEDFLK